MSGREQSRQVAVRCRGVSKTFGQGETRVQALQNVDLDVRFGELTLLEGPSGSGKTTLLSVAAGLLTPDEGELEVLGHRLNDMSDRDIVELRRGNVGFVFQQFNLLPALTAAENAAIPQIINGRSRRQATQAARDLLDKVDLGHRAAALPAKLSGGEKQRVAIARALVHEPRLVFCDEPTASLDEKNGRAIMQLLRKMAVGTDRAVLVVSHDPRVYEFSDRVAVLRDGQVSDVHPAEEPHTAGTSNG